MDHEGQYANGAAGGAPGAVTGGTLYVIGGLNAAGSYIRTVEAYSPTTNTWVTKTSLPEPRAGLGAVARNGLIFAVGGRNNTGLLATNETYRVRIDGGRPKS